ncbi:GldG family protein [Methyloterricola oryzae]|uniref:GldG family protein n=1 Tax=Methyloterricola oryzae TaxID=1495050 RepID=UPI0005EBB94C|nr:GldG family protein [Methyloterricola oryzae]
MKINARTHLEIRLQNLSFTLLFLAAIGLLAWLSTRYSTQFDWTAGGRNTLSEASSKVLDLLQGPAKVTAYAREDKGLRQRITDQVGRFSRKKPDLALAFVNPDLQPDKVRELGITVDGELIIEYQGRSEQVQEATESAIANALQRLVHAKEQHVVFLEGHGERSPKGQANHDLGQFGDELGRKGIGVSMVNLAVTPDIPDNTDLLVLASPEVNLLPGEVSLIQAYVKKGGNLLWLAEPGDIKGLAPLAQQLGLKFLPGTVVDASTQLFGINDPTFALVAEYPPHPVTLGFEMMSLYPGAAAIEKEGEVDFERTPILGTLKRSWTETGPIKDKIQFDANTSEREGPLEIAYALVRPKPKTDGDKPEATEAGQAKETKPAEQRVLVVGDGDFLTNAFLGNGGNLNLGLNMIHWLSQNEAFLNIPAKAASDRTLNLSSAASGSIAIGFLFLLPFLLIGAGALIWFNRRRR